MSRLIRRIPSESMPAALSWHRILQEHRWRPHLVTLATSDPPAVYVIAVAVDPLSPNVVYVGTQNEGFFKSADYGDTWASVGTGLSGAITYLTVDPTEGGRLFASTATAFYLSEDGGVTWTNVLNSPAWTVTIDPSDPSTVYATARTQGVFRSSDGGHTWQSVNSGLTNLTMGRSAPVIIDPTNRQTLYVGSEGGRRLQEPGWRRPLVRGELGAQRSVCHGTCHGPGPAFRPVRLRPERRLQNAHGS